MAVSTAGDSCAVGSRGALVQVVLYSAVATSRVFGALGGVAEALTAWVMSLYSRLLVDEFRDFANVKKAEGPDWDQEGNNPGCFTRIGIYPVSGWSAADRSCLGLYRHLFGN